MTWSGTRTFWRRKSFQHRIDLPARTAFMMGICSPPRIRRAHRASGSCRRCPARAQRSPQIRPVGGHEKSASATVMSGKCPVPSQMSLVIRMSSGASASGGNTSRKCVIVRGRVPMKDGILSVACASDRPARPSAPREVVRFAHDGRERGAHDRGRRLVDDGDQPRPQHFERYSR